MRDIIDSKKELEKNVLLSAIRRLAVRMHGSDLADVSLVFTENNEVDELEPGYYVRILTDNSIYSYLASQDRDPIQALHETKSNLQEQIENSAYI